MPIPTPCLPAMIRTDDRRPARRWAPPITGNLALSPRDQVAVIQLAGGRYSVAVTLAPAPRPTGQTDDLNERLVHGARFSSYAAAMRLCARVARAGRIDVTRWLWEPREHGRFVAPPVAVPYDVER